MVETAHGMGPLPFGELNAQLLGCAAAVDGCRATGAIAALTTQDFAGFVITRQTLLINGVAVMLQHQLLSVVVHLDQEIAAGIKGDEALR